ncbi:hypothetical protein TNIN_425101 [Trichonephila inaurata madagascariensis]|uniref:Peptidase A2 domain-containing protein n=1 Tax=Trichonephila inaurata madagascariensis TaxID=2747483 RepID=A0A8X6ILL1_9ARAC|nr:hypothetical protein TNIN_425101 [Trichonephila inaurata madagascariensis]
MAFLEKAEKQDLILLAEEFGQKVSDKMTVIDFKNIIIGSKDYEEEFVKAYLSVISEELVERETEGKIARQHAIEQMRLESELHKLRLENESIRSNVRRTRVAQILRCLPMTELSDTLRVVHVKVKGEQEMVNAVIDTGAQMPVVRADVVEGQGIDNRGSIQITSAFGKHEMGELKGPNMKMNDLRHGVVLISKIWLTTC